jgi:hypothetical protein
MLHMLNKQADHARIDIVPASQDNNKSNKSNKNTEDMELGHLWKNYVISSRHRRWRKFGLSAVALVLIVGALFVEDDHAWAAVGVMVEVLNDTADYVMDALGVEWL